MEIKKIKGVFINQVKTVVKIIISTKNIIFIYLKLRYISRKRSLISRKKQNTLTVTLRY